MSLSRAIAFVLDREKGLVDDPEDPGGLTNWGIALKRHPELTAAQIRSMTAQQAGEIYAGPQYWGAVHGYQLPDYLSVPMLDGAVLEGPTGVVIALQRALRVTADGTIGAQTLNAASRAADQRGVLEQLGAQRLVRLAVLPTWQHDALGWSARVVRASMEAIS